MVLIFTEATTHGTLPWRGAGERRAVLFTCCPRFMQREKASPGAAPDERFTPRQRDLMAAPFVSAPRSR